MRGMIAATGQPDSPMRSLVRLSLAGSISGLCPRYPAALFLTHTQNTIEKATAMQYRVEYNQGEDGQWYTSIMHVNGERLYTSEGYTRRSRLLRRWRISLRMSTNLVSITQV